MIVDNKIIYYIQINGNIVQITLKMIILWP